MIKESLLIENFEGIYLKMRKIYPYKGRIYLKTVKIYPNITKIYPKTAIIYPNANSKNPTS